MKNYFLIKIKNFLKRKKLRINPLNNNHNLNNNNKKSINLNFNYNPKGN